MVRSLTLILAVLGAGCVAPVGLQGIDAPPGSAAAAEHRLLCPDGSRPTDVPSCAARLSHGDGEAEEPYLAVSPIDDRIVAVGTNVAPALIEMAMRARDPSGVPTCIFGLFLSEDGGETWREVEVPLPRAQGRPLDGLVASCGFDPALVFDGLGQLHLTGIVVERVVPWVTETNTLGAYEDQMQRTFYVRTPDLGRSWSEPIVVSENGAPQDRNWIVRDADTGTLFITWQNVDGEPESWTTEIAWSVDGGTTWRNQAPRDRPRCFTPGLSVADSGGLTLACHEGSVSEGRVLVLRFHPGTGRLEQLAALDENAIWPQLARSGPNLSLTAWRLEPEPSGTYVFASSPDDGRTWAPAIPIPEIVPGGWDFARVDAFSASERGEVHALVRLLRRDVGMPVALAADDVWRFSYLRLSPDGTLLQEMPVFVEDPGYDLPGAPPLTNPLFDGDHYWGLDWTSDGTLFAYTSGDSVRVLRTRG